jgi:hypothetical protein
MVRDSRDRLVRGHASGSLNAVNSPVPQPSVSPELISGTPLARGRGPSRSPTAFNVRRSAPIQGTPRHGAQPVNDRAFRAAWRAW